MLYTIDNPKAKAKMTTIHHKDLIKIE
jgi:hypothetical protein